ISATALPRQESARRSDVVNRPEHHLRAARPRLASMHPALDTVRHNWHILSQRIPFSVRREEEATSIESDFRSGKKGLISRLDGSFHKGSNATPANGANRRDGTRW